MDVSGMIWLWITQSLSLYLNDCTSQFLLVIACGLICLFSLTNALTCKSKWSHYVSQCHLPAWTCSSSICWSFLFSVTSHSLSLDINEFYVYAIAMGSQTISNRFGNEIGLCFMLSLFLTSDLILFTGRLIFV